MAEIEKQMLEIAARLGYKDLKSLNAKLQTDPALHAKSREQILDLYRGYIDGMYTKLPALFGRLPKAKVLVIPTEAFREKEASGAEYQMAAPDGSRPGRVEVNTSDPTSRKTISMESTAYHEKFCRHGVDWPGCGISRGHDIGRLRQHYYDVVALVLQFPAQGKRRN